MENLSNSNLARLRCASMLSNQEQNLIHRVETINLKDTGRETKIKASTLTTQITIVLWESVSSGESYNCLSLENEKLAEQEREKELQERARELKEGDSVLVTAFPRKKHFSCPREDAHKKGGKNSKKHPPCHLAHNPLQLELTPINKKIENLKSV